MISLLQLFNERIAIHSFDEYLKAVADAYIHAPAYEPQSVGHWKALNAADWKLFKHLSSTISFKVVSGQPYQSMEQMRDDVKKNKRLFVSDDFSQHPVFSVDDNVVFRAVHDYMAHVIVGAPFGGHGKIRAYNTQCKLFPKDAVPALFTEIVGQAAVAITTGRFPEQKIALLPQFDYYNIGRMSQTNVPHKVKHQKEIY